MNGNIGFSGSPTKMKLEYQKDTENEEEKRPSPVKQSSAFS